MSKLRVVQERKSMDVHESDLRGLGEDSSLLNDVTPMPTLSVKTSETGKDEIEKLCMNFGFEVSIIFKSDVMHIQPAHSNEKFKEQLIDLFGIMLLIEAKMQAAFKHSQLWLWDRLRGRVHGDGKHTNSGFDNTYKAILKNIGTKKLSGLHDGVSIYLRQAGFSLPRNTEYTHLTETMVQDNLKSLLEAQDANSCTRAGGES